MNQDNNSNSSFSASYAYYSFPPTPTRDHASPSTASARSSRDTVRMAPSPTTDVPKTPTRVGKDPASSATSRLTGQDPTTSAKSAATPRSKPPKLGASKAKQVESPKLPPRPKAADSSVGDGESVTDDAKGIDLKDNDPEEESGQIGQSANEPEIENSSVADTSELSEADPRPIADEAEKTTTKATGKAEDDGEGSEGHGTSVPEEPEDDDKSATGEPGEDVPHMSGGLASDTKDAAGKVAEGDTNGTVKETAEEVQDTAEKTKEGVHETAEEAKEATSGAAEDPPAEDSGAAVNGVKETAEDGVNGVKETVEDGVNGVKDTAEDGVDGVKDTAEDGVDGVKDTAEDGVDGVKATAEDVDLPTDLSALKGLKVGSSGEIHDADGNAVGQLEEGDPADLEGYEVGDDGEILDEDGDVVGRVKLLPAKAEEAATQAKDEVGDADKEVEGAKEDIADGVETYLPDINVLEGLEVQESGEIIDAHGTVLGKITEGDPADLVGMALNAEGEVLDEDGDVVGRAEVLPQEVKEKVEDAVPIAALEGLEVGHDGDIKDAEGKVLGKITEGDPADLVGRQLNAEGEVLDEDGDVIGRAEVVPEAAGEAVEEAKATPDEISALEAQLVPDITILEGRKLNKKGNILDEEGDVLARLVEGDPKACAGKIPNENGEILDEEGNVIGKVEVVQGEAAEEAMKVAHPELVEQLEEAKVAAEEAKAAAEKAEEAAPEAGLPDFAILEGLKVNKKGEVLNEDGEPIAKLAEGDLDAVRGKKINEKGEIVDKDGKVLGKVEFLPEAIEAGLVEVEEPVNGVPDVDLSILEGLKVNKKGEVVDEDGEPIARLIEGELDQVKGKKLNAKGEIVDKDGKVIGKVELIAHEAEELAPEEGQDAGPELPSLSILEGLKVNKAGKIVDSNGKLVGELVEGDAKKIWKSGAACDDKGQFWDGKGHVIGKAVTLPEEDEHPEGEFSGLEGLIVVKDGWVEDENGNRVGKLVEGDAKKLVGRAVDEDGDVIDKRGSVVGHAERYTEPEPEEEVEPEPEVIDLSELKGLTVNKQGNVIGPDGVPIAKLVEGNPKELAGRKIDANGQLWDESGKVVGRCEMIPPEQREAKPEGPFAGLEGLVVVKDGFVEDHEHNIVGKLVDGDPKRLIGRAVDEDGDIIDKYGNVKGHCEPYTPPEEEVVEEDLSSLAGKKVNKQGKVVDEHGTIYGEIVDGDPKKLAGHKVDGKGQIWSDDGKVIGQARLITGGDDGKAEGPFSNFESTVVSKDGLVKDASGETVGRVIEGDHKKLVGRKVEDDGDILDKNGNVIGKAERWEPEEKAREVNAMSGLRVNKEGEVRDKNGDVIGKLTDGNLLHCVGREINDNGYVVDQDGNKLGEVTLLENIPEEEVDEGPTEQEVKDQEERDVAKKIANIIGQTLEKMEPICKQITEHIEKADRTPREELDEEALVQAVKPLIEEGSRILGECNGAIRGLDPDGHIAANAKARHASGEASPEENRVAEGLKDLTSVVVKTIDNAKKRIADMPHAKKKLNPLWGLLTEPLFQIIAAVGLLLSGVLGLVGKLLNALGLGGLVNGLLGGLGIDKLLGGLGLGSITEAIGLGGGKKKK